MKPHDSDRYRRNFLMDVALLVGILVLLYTAEIFVVYTVLSQTWGSTPEVGGLAMVFIAFAAMLLAVETLGCVKVLSSIRQHMRELEYYG